MVAPNISAPQAPAPCRFRASLLCRKLASRPGRIEFAMLRTTPSHPAAPHPASRRRSCVQLQVHWASPGLDFHHPDHIHSQPHGTAREERAFAPPYTCCGVIPPTQLNNWYLTQKQFLDDARQAPSAARQPPPRVKQPRPPAAASTRRTDATDHRYLRQRAACRRSATLASGIETSSSMAFAKVGGGY
jgi:hypothetical protein